MGHESFQIRKKDRTTSSWDAFAIWIGANANNGTWFIGGVLAACGFTLTTRILILSSALPYIFLSLVGYVEYKTNLSTMIMARASFGERSSHLPSLVNITQPINWTAVNTFTATQSISLPLKNLLNMHNETLGLTIGIIVMSILHILSVASGSKSIQLIGHTGVTLVFIFIIWGPIAVFKTVSLNQIISWKAPNSGKIALGSAIDYVTAFSLAWVTAGADFICFTKKKSNSTIALFRGAPAGVIWLVAIGLILIISIAITSGVCNANNSDPSIIANELDLGIVALLVIILTSMTANAVNLLAAGPAFSNIFLKIRSKHSLWTVVNAATLVIFIPMFVGSPLEIFEGFLDYVGIVLGSIIAIICTNYYFAKKRDYEIPQFGKTSGTHWYKSGVNRKAIIVSILGMIIFLIGKNIRLLSNTIGIISLDMTIRSLLCWVLTKE